MKEMCHLGDEHIRPLTTRHEGKRSFLRGLAALVAGLLAFAPVTPASAAVGPAGELAIQQLSDPAALTEAGSEVKIKVSATAGNGFAFEALLLALTYDADKLEYVSHTDDPGLSEDSIWPDNAGLVFAEWGKPGEYWKRDTALRGTILFNFGHDSDTTASVVITFKTLAACYPWDAQAPVVSVGPVAPTDLMDVAAYTLAGHTTGWTLIKTGASHGESAYGNKLNATPLTDIGGLDEGGFANLNVDVTREKAPETPVPSTPVPAPLPSVAAPEVNEPIPSEPSPSVIVAAPEEEKGAKVFTGGWLVSPDGGLPWMIGGLGLAAAILILVAYRRRKKEQTEE
ncbi:MAG: hypothetical protein LBR21_04690 [Propionibacteriaceae bacterium]|jgi:hypothetical protein|nr:hypothetical protein [Propionibacteriaceae bacterium]